MSRRLAAVVPSLLTTVALFAVATPGQAATNGNGFPEAGQGRSCQLPNGTIIKDGSTIVTSHGTEISCVNGNTCRMTRSGTRQGCKWEPGPRAMTRTR